MRIAAMALLLSACGPPGFHHVRRPAPPVLSEAGPMVSVAPIEDLDAGYWTERIAGHVGRGELTLALEACAAAPSHDAALDAVCGLAALRSGDLHAARERWEPAASAGSIPAMHLLARLAIAQRDAETALRITQAWVAAASREYEAWRLRGRALRLADHFEAARAAFELAITLDPERPDAHYELGVLWMSYAAGREEHAARATEHFDRFMAHAHMRGEYASVLQTLTGACEARGGDARARARARRWARRDACMGYLGRLRTPPILTLHDIEEMQRMAAEMEAANAAAATELEAEAREAEAAAERAAPR
jgi:tetratricopeptide (TPR) repeat protein